MALSPPRRSWASIPLRSRVTGVDANTLRRWLADLPPPVGYAVSARPLRYRQAPHLAAFCWYEDRLIELQVPEPFRAWDEKVAYRARIPLAMSIAALALVLGHIAIFGTARQADEGTAAHLWQLLMAGQIPIIAFFAIKWLPRTPGSALSILALQAVAGLAAAAPVFLLNF